MTFHDYKVATSRRSNTWRKGEKDGRGEGVPQTLTRESVREKTRGTKHEQTREYHGKKKASYNRRGPLQQSVGTTKKHEVCEFIKIASKLN